MKMRLLGRQRTVSTCLIWVRSLKLPIVFPHKKKHVDVTPLLSQTHMAVSSFVSAHLSTFAPGSNMKSTGPIIWLGEPRGGKTCQERPVTCFTTRRSTEVQNRTIPREAPLRLEDNLLKESVSHNQLLTLPEDNDISPCLNPWKRATPRCHYQPHVPPSRWWSLGVVHLVTVEVPPHEGMIRSIAKKLNLAPRLQPGGPLISPPVGGDDFHSTSTCGLRISSRWIVFGRDIPAARLHAARAARSPRKLGSWLMDAMKIAPSPWPRWWFRINYSSRNVRHIEV